MPDTETDPSVTLIKALAQNIEGADATPWESMAIVISSYDGRFNSASGYAYSADGTILAVAARPSRVMPAIDAYVSSYFKPGEKLPVMLLVQYDKKSGQYSVQLEDTDETRWKITPGNFETLRETLRPRFDAPDTDR